MSVDTTVTTIPKYLQDIDEVPVRPVQRYSYFTVYASDKPPKASIELRTLFVYDNVETFMALGCDKEQAINATANVVLCTMSGLSYIHYNGSKILARPSSLKGGRRWFKVKTDNGLICYTAFKSMSDFNKFWLEKYVPKPGPNDVWPDSTTREDDYRPASLFFWKVGGRSITGWFDKYIEGGGMGEEVRLNTELRKQTNETFTEILQVTEDTYSSPFGMVKQYQSVLKTLGYYDGPVNDQRGIKTTALLTDLQRQHGLPQTGAMSSALAQLIVKELREYVDNNIEPL